MLLWRSYNAAPACKHMHTHCTLPKLIMLLTTLDYFLQVIVQITVLNLNLGLVRCSVNYVILFWTTIFRGEFAAEERKEEKKLPHDYDKAKCLRNFYHATFCHSAESSSASQYYIYTVHSEDSQREWKNSRSAKAFCFARSRLAHTLCFFVTVLLFLHA